MGTKRKRNYPTMTTKAGYALLSSCGMFIETVPRTKREENGHFNGNDQQQVINDHPQEVIIAMAHTGAHHRRHDVAVFSSSPSSAMSDPCHCNNSNGNGCGILNTNVLSLPSTTTEIRWSTQQHTVSDSIDGESLSPEDWEYIQGSDEKRIIEVEKEEEQEKPIVPAVIWTTTASQRRRKRSPVVTVIENGQKMLLSDMQECRISSSSSSTRSACSTLSMECG